MSLELGEEVRARVQGAEQGNISEGWEYCREQQRVAWGLEEWSEFGRSKRNWGEFGAKQ